VAKKKNSRKSSKKESEQKREDGRKRRPRHGRKVVVLRHEKKNPASGGKTAPGSAPPMPHAASHQMVYVGRHWGWERQRKRFLLREVVIHPNSGPQRKNRGGGSGGGKDSPSTKKLSRHKKNTPWPRKAEITKKRRWERR